MDVLQGTLDLLVLKTLAWGPMHGYGVSRWIHERTESVLLVEDAALYQALHRLARKGLVELFGGSLPVTSSHSRSRNSFSFLPNSTNSVGQTAVKSLG